MNRDQARIMLWGLWDAGDEDRRAAAIDVVLDLMQEQVITVEPPSMPSAAVLDAMHKRLAELDAREKPSTPEPSSPSTDESGEVARLKHESEILTAAVESWSNLWRRVQAAARVDEDSLGSTEATIDRIAYLAELDRGGTGLILDQRNDLLAAARAFVEADDSVGGRYALELAAVVARINRQSETPAEGAARLRVE